MLAQTKPNANDRQMPQNQFQDFFRVLFLDCIPGIGLKKEDEEGKGEEQEVCVVIVMHA